MEPVFLVVSGRLDDTNQLLSEIKEWLAEFLGPLVYELRDSVNELDGIPTGGQSYGAMLEQVIVNQRSLLVANGLLIGVILGVGLAWLVTKLWRR